MNEMPRGGVKELIRSSEGKRHLTRLQEKYKYDIVQPSTDPHLFDQLYGEKIKKQKERHALDVSRARGLWEESRSRRDYARTRSRRKIFV